MQLNVFGFEDKQAVSNGLNMDFDQRITIDTNLQAWESGSGRGVWHKTLAYKNAAQGHSTSVIRLEPGARLPAHYHPFGEELLVLSGTFSDHTGDYPAGSYFRNPPGFRHAPFSKEGCDLLVKLHQFQATDEQRICISSRGEKWQQGLGRLAVISLHSFNTEHVALVKWPAGERFRFHRHIGGEEIFVLQGELIDEYGRYPAGSWVRSPHMSTHHPYVEEETVIWVKIGHLLNGL